MKTDIDQEAADLVEDVIGDLSGPLPIEPYHDQESARTFSGKGVVAVLDSPFFDFSDTTVLIDGEVPAVRVVDDQGRLLGYANLSLQGPKLVAAFSIRYDSPERLSLETQSPLMYFQVRGRLDWHLDVPDETVEAGVLDLLGSKVVVDVIKVDALVLSQNKPKDDRVSPIGPPVL